MREIDQKMLDMEATHYKSKQDQLNNERDANKQLAEAKREKEIQDKLSETFNNFAEINNQLTGDLLTEMGNTIRADNPNRVVPYAFKGMTPEKVREIQDEQARQAKEREVLNLELPETKKFQVEKIA